MSRGRTSLSMLSPTNLNDLNLEGYDLGGGPKKASMSIEDSDE